MATHNSIDLGLVTDSPSVTDWAQHIEDRIDTELIASGSGAKTGTVIVSDRYPLDRQLNIDDRVFLMGAHRVGHHSGGSCGFYRADIYGEENTTWSGDYLVKWSNAQLNGADIFYSNFGSGAENIHFTGGGDVGGVYYVGAQQGAGLTNVYIRNFMGPNGTDVRSGLVACGDTWSGTDIFIDAEDGSTSTVKSGCTGFDFTTHRCYSLNLRNLTTHNCGIGLAYQEFHSVLVESLETETTTKPVVATYNSRAVEFRGCCFRHTDELVDLQRMRWYDDTSVKMSGIMADNAPGVVRLSDTDGNNEIVTSERQTFDFIIEKRESGQRPTNWTNRRII